MAENLCIMLTESEAFNTLVRVMLLVGAAGDLHKRAVFYVGGRWSYLAQQGGPERGEQQTKGINQGPPLTELLRRFQNGGGQVWLAADDAREMNLAKKPLIPGAYVVDEPTLLNFLMQDTVVLNF
jgi:hypothetical protein